MSLEVNLVIDLGKTHNKFYIFDTKTHRIKKVFINKNNLLQKKELEINLDQVKFQLDNFISYTLRKYKINFINCCTHGSVVIGLNSKKKIISKISDENKYPKNLDKKFFNFVSNSRNTFTPFLENGHNLLKVIFYLKNFKKKLFTQVKNFLFYPQFISFYLSKNITSEISYIGNHSFLWNFKKNTFSNFYNYFNLGTLINNYQKPHNLSGYLDKIFFKDIEYYKIPILTGGHDSMSCLSYHEKIFKKKFILLSSGTWFVFYHPFKKVTNKEFYYTINFNKKKITTFRFPGGILFEKLIKKSFEKECKLNCINDVLNNNDFLLKKNKAHPNFSKKYLYYLGMIFLALKAYHLLKKIGKIKYPIIVDGVSSKNRLFLKILSCLIKDQKIYKSNDIHGVAKGMLIKKIEKKSKNYTLIKKDLLLRKKLIKYYQFHKEKL